MTNSTNKPNMGFWIIGIVAMIWNGLGVHGYLQQTYMTEGFKTMYTEEQLDLISNIPAYVTAAFAIAVFAGVIGSLLLLLRKKMATTVLTISLLAVLVQMSYNIFTGLASDIYGPGGIIMPIMILIIAFFLVWYSRRSTAIGWLS